MTNPEEDSRITRVLTALHQAQPDELRQAGRLIPGSGEILTKLADALESDEPAAGVKQVMDDLGDPEALRAKLQPVLDAASRDFRQAAARMEAMERSVSRLEASQATLAEGIKAIHRECTDDPELASVVEEALEVARDRRAVELLSQALTEVCYTNELIRDALSSPGTTRTAASLRARVQSMEGLVERAQQAATDLGERLLPLLRKASRVSAARGHGMAPSLATLEARIGEQLRVGGDSTIEDRWRRALDVGLQQKDLAISKQAARRVQRGAIAREDWRLMALVSHRLAELAGEQRDLGLFVSSRMEQALALIRDGAQAEGARALAEQTLRDAESAGTPQILAQARRMAAEVLEAVEEEEEARRLLRRLLREGKGKAVQVHTAARAALQLGRLEQRAGRLHAARKNIQTAYEVARAEEDLSLFEAAVPALVDVLLARGEPEEAAHYTREAGAIYAQAGQAPAYAEAMGQRFGEARIHRWLEDASPSGPSGQ